MKKTEQQHVVPDTQLLEIVRVCDTPDSRRNGARGIEEFHDEDCVLFRYDSPHSLRFWNGGLGYKLWVSSIVDGVVADCQPLPRDNQEPVVLNGEADMAVETRHRLIVGSRVSVSGSMVMVSRP